MSKEWTVKFNLNRLSRREASANSPEGIMVRTEIDSGQIVIKHVLAETEVDAKKMARTLANSFLDELAFKHDEVLQIKDDVEQASFKTDRGTTHTHITASDSIGIVDETCFIVKRGADTTVEVFDSRKPGQINVSQRESLS